MGEEKTAPARGRKKLPEEAKMKRLVLCVQPSLSAWLEAEDQPPEERKAVAKRRKRKAAEILLQWQIDRRFV